DPRRRTAGRAPEDEAAPAIRTAQVKHARVASRKSTFPDFSSRLPGTKAAKGRDEERSREPPPGPPWHGESRYLHGGWNGGNNDCQKGECRHGQGKEPEQDREGDPRDQARGPDRARGREDSSGSRRGLRPGVADPGS